MKKKIFNIIAILTLMASFALPAFMTQNAWADNTSELQSACSTLGGSFNVSGASSSGVNWHCNGAKTAGTASSSEISKIQSACSTLGKSFTVTNGGSSGLSWRCTGSGPINNKIDDGNSPTANSGDTTDAGGGGTSGTAGSSSATSGATESSPQSLYDNRQCPEGEVYTSIIGGGGCVSIEDNGGNIFSILNTVLTILTYGVGIAGTLGIVISGIQYLTARDNEQQMVKAKSRLINIVIGLAAYAFMWAFLQWLIPGGLLNGGN